MNLQQRIEQAIADFNRRHPDWDCSITSYLVEGSRRGKGPGASLYVGTLDGMGFEIPIEPDDDVAAFVGLPRH